MRDAAAWLVLCFCLLANVWFQRQNPPARFDMVDLGIPPPVMAVRTAALGENTFAAYLAMISLQNVDVPLGRATPLADLERNTVIRWLDLAADLDPGTGYPLLLAVRHYAETGSPADRRMMLDWVYRRFEECPNRRWPWLTHAVFVARHVLHDDALAEFYAAALRTQVSDPTVPTWVRQMDLLLRADLGQTADARVILGGLIDAGQIRSPEELKFLESRLLPESPVVHEGPSSP